LIHLLPLYHPSPGLLTILFPHAAYSFYESDLLVSKLNEDFFFSGFEQCEFIVVLLYDMRAFYRERERERHRFR